MMVVSLICPNGKAVTHKVKGATHHTISVDDGGLRTVKFYAKAPAETMRSLVASGTLPGIHDQEDIDELPGAVKESLQPRGLISTLSVPETFVLQVTPEPDEKL